MRLARTGLFKPSRKLVVLIALCGLFSYLFWPTFKQASCLLLSERFCQNRLKKFRDAADIWDLFYYLGGNGPWIPKLKGTVGNASVIPEGCVVDQVHMLSRHAERFPTKIAGMRHLALLKRLKNQDSRLRGSLYFVNEWEYFANPDASDFEDLTSSGPFAGTAQALATGEKLRERYRHMARINVPLHFWSCSSVRDIETATCFADGFIGLNWANDNLAKLHIIPETSDRGADTLTPGDTCVRYIDDKEYGHDYGYRQLAIWQDIFTKPIFSRLITQNPGLSLSPLDIYSMMEFCGFEILARGESPWCGVFTIQEWLDFEYARDLLHFYRAGPGNKYAGAMGWLWLNTTQELISQEATRGAYLSFVHDSDIVPMLTALGVYNGDRQDDGPQDELRRETTPYLPADRVPADRVWKTSDIVPMGGRIIFEKLTCLSVQVRTKPEIYIRLSINDGVIPIYGDHVRDISNRGLWPLDAFQGLIRRRGDEVGDFQTVCGLDETAPKRISFLHQ